MSDEAARRSESSGDIELRAVLDTAVHGIIIIDERGLVREYSASCETIFGWTAAEVLGRNVRMLMPSPDRERHDGYLSRYLRTGERRIIGLGREVAGLRKDGSRFPMDLSVGETRLDGRPVFVGVIRDITEAKRAEQALKDSEARLRGVIETAVDGVIIMDANGVVQTFNRACERLFGWSASEVEGRNVAMLMPAPDREAHDGHLARYRRTRERRIVGLGREVQAQRKDGSSFPCELSVGEMRQGDSVAFVGILRDLSERKRIEQELLHAHKLDAIGQLTGGIAHDFNNLLTVISGNLEMLDGLVADPEQRALVAEARETTELGAQLTSRLLGFARRQSLEPRVIDPNELVLDMSDLLRRTLGQSIRISTVLASRLKPVRADPGQLQNALLNLALNGRDAMPRGGELIVETANAELDQADVADLAPGRYVAISVTDSGGGMTPEIKAKAIEPFFTTKGAGGGTGLGLSMVYGFARQSGGGLRIESEPGLGTTVTIYLPQSDEAREPSQAPSRPAREVRGEGQSILVVEDDPRVRLVTARRLRELGYAVAEAAGSQEALDLLDRRAFDLLLTDVLMPGGLSGPDLARQVLRRHPGLNVLFASGYADPDAMRAAMEEFDAALLRKPYRKGDLASAVVRALGRPSAPAKPRR